MKFYLRLSLMISLAMFVFASCKKPKTTSPESPSTTIVLSQTTSGNVITLKWTPINEPSVTGYIIIRSDSMSVSKYFQVDKNTTTLVDTLPLAPKINYVVQATVPSVQGVTWESNAVTVTRDNLNMVSLYPYDALYDQGNQQIYVYSYDGNIKVYDVNAKKWTREASWNANLGYCELGVYNGTTELYVPRQDGWLFIYDAATLTKTDQINVGTQAASVSYNNGILYVCACVSGYSNYNIVSYSRASKLKIGEAYASDKTRLRLIPGSNAEFFGITDYSSFRSYKFDGSGKYLSQVNGYSNGASLNPAICEVFPDGNHFITNSMGSIYGRDLAYQTALPRGNASFSSFCFDNGNNLLYAGCYQKQIQAYGLGDYQLSKTINTEGVPFKVFFNNGSLISVSTATAANSGFYGSASSNYTFIERF